MKKPGNTTFSLIFTGIAMVGVGITSTLAAVRAPRYKEIIEACEAENEEMKPTTKVAAGFKAQWPAIVSGALTCAAIAAIDIFSFAEIGVLSGALAAAFKNRKAIENQIEKHGGKELLNKIKTEASKELVRENVKYIRSAGPSVEETGRGDLLCYDAFGGRWFRSTEVDVRRAIDKVCEDFMAGYNVSFNDLYSALGIEETRFGYEFGWVNNPDYYDGPLEFTIDLVEAMVNPDNMGGQMATLDEPVLIIDILTFPMNGWYEI